MNKKRIIIFVLLLIIAISIFAAVFKQTFEKQKYPLYYADLIDEYAGKNGLEPELVAAVIYCESSFDENAVSRAGAVGLMQLMPDTFDWLSRLMEDDFIGGEIDDIETNISCGCYYLGWMQRKFGSQQAAIAGYNAGHGITAKWLADTQYSTDGMTLDSIPYSETQKYVEKVMKTKEIYKSLYYNEEAKNDDRTGKGA